MKDLTTSRLSTFFPWLFLPFSINVKAFVFVRIRDEIEVFLENYKGTYTIMS